MIKFIYATEYLNDEEVNEIAKDEMFSYFPKAGVFFYNNEYENELVEKYSFVQDYLKEYDDRLNSDSYLKENLEWREIEIATGVFVNMNDVIDLTTDIMEDILWNDIIIKGETYFNEWLNTCISDVASNQIGNMMRRLIQKGFNINTDMLPNID